MADLNKTPNPTNDPSYLGLSQGTDRPQPNRVFGSLFEGIGQTIAADIQIKDKENLDNISKELYRGVDSIRDSQGVGTAVAGESILHTTTRELPEPVQTSTDTIDRLTQAYAAGKISDTSYWTKVESLVRQVRAKYPGYREEIDKKVSSITGTTPANALRNSILNDLQKLEARSVSQMDKFESWERTNMEWIALVAPDYFNRKAAGNPYSKEWILNSVAQKQASVKQIDINNKELANAEAEGKLTENVASSYATNAANTFAWNTLDAAKAIKLSNGMTFDQVIDQVISSGKPPSPELLQELMGQINNVEAQMNLGLSKLMTQINPETGKSYSYFMRGDVNKINNIKQSAMAPLLAIKNAIATGDLAVAKYWSNLVKSQTDATSARILAQGGAVQTLAGVANLNGGEAIVPHLLSESNKGFLNELTQQITNMNTMKVATGNQTVDQAIAEINRETNRNPNANAKIINDVATLLGKNDVTSDAFLNLAKGTFSSNFLERLESSNPSAQLNFFKKLLSPSIQKKMEEVKGTDPQLYNQYTNWVMKNTASLFRQQFSDLKQGIETVPYLEVRYDQKTSQFLAKVNKEGQKLLSEPAIGTGSLLVQPQINTAMQGIKQVNEVLQTITPILKKNGQDVPQVLDALFRDMGVNPNNKKQSSLTGKLHRALVGGLKNTSLTEQPDGNITESGFSEGFSTGFNSPDPTNNPTMSEADFNSYFSQ